MKHPMVSMIFPGNYEIYLTPDRFGGAFGVPFFQKSWKETNTKTNKTTEWWRWRLCCCNGGGVCVLFCFFFSGDTVRTNIRMYTKSRYYTDFSWTSVWVRTATGNQRPLKRRKTTHNTAIAATQSPSSSLLRLIRLRIRLLQLIWPLNRKNHHFWIWATFSDI